MAEPINVGVIGLGKMGMVHAAILNTLENARLVAACEPNATLRSGFASFAPEIRFFETHKQLLDASDLSAVYITTPTEYHVEAALDSVTAGCAIFVEKPLSLDVASADRLLAALPPSTTTMVGFMMRYVDSFARAKQLLDEGAIGSPISVEGTVYTSQVFTKGKGWRASKKKSGGGTIILQGIHALDLIGWYFGLPSDLAARTISPYSGEVEDFAHVTFGWESGLIGWLDCSWSVDNRRLMEVRIQVTGDTGTLVVDDDGVRLYNRANGRADEAWTSFSRTDLSSGVAVDIGGPQYTREDQAFVEAVRS